MAWIRSTQREGCVKFKFGDVTVRKIFELDSTYLPLRFAFPEVSVEHLAGLRRWYWNAILDGDPEKSRMELFLHSYVLQINNKNILIDTCCGDSKPRNIPFFNQLSTPYLQNLAAAGLTPGDIDVVMCTHLHFDHVGWNTRLENGSWVPTFPNARYIFTRADYEHFDKNRSDPVYGAAFCDSVLPVVEHGLAELVETDFVLEHEIGSGVWLQGAPGHSPGSSMVHVKHGTGSLVFSGDTFHHPMQVAYPDLQFSGDEDAAVACRTRASLFAQLADSPTVVFPAHFGATSGGHVVRHADSYRYEFLAAQT
jgi:glyoxylase-like metal-dependent hydrolase (beta-lactamase superfamily II)